MVPPSGPTIAVVENDVNRERASLGSGRTAVLVDLDRAGAYTSAF
jgi:hypothetical protein